MSTAKTPLTVVYDSRNLASKLEVDKLKAKDTSGQMALVDIAADGKAEEHGCTDEAVRKTIHVRDAEGRVFVGIEAIGALHDAVGLSGYFRFCRTPGLTSGPSGFFPKKAA
ncbi:MAG: hypothetical protein LPJ91_09935 [Pseudazoarcus pumilus]|nr:hypothetical protein [Pseudazoarcus pumilus]